MVVVGMSLLPLYTLALGRLAGMEEPSPIVHLGFGKAGRHGRASSHCTPWLWEGWQAWKSLLPLYTLALGRLAGMEEPSPIVHLGFGKAGRHGRASSHCTPWLWEGWQAWKSLLPLYTLALGRLAGMEEPPPIVHLGFGKAGRHGRAFSHCTPWLWKAGRHGRAFSHCTPWLWEGWQAWKSLLPLYTLALEGWQAWKSLLPLYTLALGRLAGMEEPPPIVHLGFGKAGRHGRASSHCTPWLWKAGRHGRAFSHCTPWLWEGWQAWKSLLPLYTLALGRLAGMEEPPPIVHLGFGKAGRHGRASSHCTPWLWEGWQAWKSLLPLYTLALGRLAGMEEPSPIVHLGFGKAGRHGRAFSHCTPWLWEGWQAWKSLLPLYTLALGRLAGMEEPPPIVHLGFGKAGRHGRAFSHCTPWLWEGWQAWKSLLPLYTLALGRLAGMEEPSPIVHLGFGKAGRHGRAFSHCTPWLWEGWQAWKSLLPLYTLALGRLAGMEEPSPIVHLGFGKAGRHGRAFSHCTPWLWEGWQAWKSLLPLYTLALGRLAGMEEPSPIVHLGFGKAGRHGRAFSHCTPWLWEGWQAWKSLLPLYTLALGRLAGMEEPPPIVHLGFGKAGRHGRASSHCTPWLWEGWQAWKSLLPLYTLALGRLAGMEEPSPIVHLGFGKAGRHGRASSHCTPWLWEGWQAWKSLLPLYTLALGGWQAGRHGRAFSHCTPWLWEGWQAWKSLLPLYTLFQVKIHCSLLVEEAVQAALKDYNGKQERYKEGTL